MFPTIKIEEEVRFQFHILGFLGVFFTGKQNIKTPIKASIKAKRNIGILSTMSV